MGSKWQSQDLNPGILAPVSTLNYSPVQPLCLCPQLRCVFSVISWLPVQGLLQSNLTIGSHIYRHYIKSLNFSTKFSCCFSFVTILLFVFHLCFFLKSYIQTKPQVSSFLTFPVVYEGENVKDQKMQILSVTFLDLYLSIPAFCFPSHYSSADPQSLLPDYEHSLPTRLFAASWRSGSS